MPDCGHIQCGDIYVRQATHGTPPQTPGDSISGPGSDTGGAMAPTRRPRAIGPELRSYTGLVIGIGGEYAKRFTVWAQDQWDAKTRILGQACQEFRLAPSAEVFEELDLWLKELVENK